MLVYSMSSATSHHRSKGPSVCCEPVLDTPAGLYLVDDLVQHVLCAAFQFTLDLRSLYSDPRGNVHTARAVRDRFAVCA